MKKLLGTDIRGSYTFDPIAKTIAFSNLASNITLENILLINNATANTVIYTFAGGTTKGQTSFTNNVLTLDFNTSSMSATDKLQIYLDVDAATFDETRSALEDQIVLLRRMVKIMESQSATDFGNRQRVAIDSTITVPVSGTVTSNIGSGTVANIAQLAGRDQQLFSEWSRTAYNTGIRSQLTFS
jgi:hypothetical protein